MFQELRFIIGSIPMFNVSASLAASRLWATILSISYHVNNDQFKLGVFASFFLREHIRCKPDTLCKLRNFQSKPQDANPRGRGEGGYRKISLEMLVVGGCVQNNPLPSAPWMSTCGLDWKFPSLHRVSGLHLICSIFIPPLWKSLMFKCHSTNICFSSSFPDIITERKPGGIYSIFSCLVPFLLGRIIHH
jgi:hypothetical protein